MTENYIIDQQASMAEFEFSRELQKQKQRAQEDALDKAMEEFTKQPAVFYDPALLEHGPKTTLIGDIERMIKKLPVYGEYQLCPKCNGRGDYSDYSRLPVLVNNQCDICEGKKILAKPIIG